MQKNMMNEKKRNRQRKENQEKLQQKNSKTKSFLVIDEWSKKRVEDRRLSWDKNKNKKKHCICGEKEKK